MIFQIVLSPTFLLEGALVPLFIPRLVG
jgi:hypothetical protein